jgi:predicted nucleic acid-binding protein
MKDKLFLDSNILVYCYSTSDMHKRGIARSLASMDNVHISTQVLNETTNVLAKKYSIPWSDLAKLIDDFETILPYDWPPSLKYGKPVVLPSDMVFHSLIA